MFNNRGMLTFNVHEGNLEAIVHGYKDGILRAEEYNNLTQCESLGDFKSQLQVTDYGGFLSNEGANTLTSRLIGEKAIDKLVHEFHEMREWADQPLAQFLDFITYEHMISNVLKLISAARHSGSREGGSASLDILYKCHPLGLFPGISSLTAATSVDDMFDTVLCDSPIGKFFVQPSGGTQQKDFDELSLEYIRGILQKNYLEAFYDFIETTLPGSETFTVMSEMLQFEADRLVVTVTANTCGMRDLHPDDRKKLYPNLGKLVDMHDDLCVCESREQLVERLKHIYPEYADVLDDGSGHGHAGLDGSGGKSMEKKFLEKSVEYYRDALTRQFQYGSFYAWVKMKELEIQNLVWIAECIVQGKKDRVNEYVPLI